MKNKTLQICLLAMFCALSAIGAQIHIQGSIALDALPAYLAALLLGGPGGAVVGALGHLLSSGLAGFPLTLPLHLVIAVEMALICFVTGWLKQKRNLSTPVCAVAAFVLNAFVSPLILLVWPGMGLAICLALLPSLAAGSAVNAFGAALLWYALRKPLHALGER